MTHSSDEAVRALFKHLIHDDHKRGCQGREYTCSCGYDDKTADLVEAADKAIATLSQPAEGWRDIASAPRDGTRILTWGCLHYDGPLEENGLSVTGETPGQYVTWWHDETGTWYSPDRGSHQPTHWQPLPAAPTNPKAEGEG